MVLLMTFDFGMWPPGKNSRNSSGGNPVGVFTRWPTRRHARQSIRLRDRHREAGRGLARRPDVVHPSRRLFARRPLSGDRRSRRRDSNLGSGDVDQAERIQGPPRSIDHPDLRAGRAAPYRETTTPPCWPGTSRPPRVADSVTLESAWNDLAAREAGESFQSEGRFLAAPADTVKLFAEKIKPVEALDPKRVQRLLADLDSDEFAVREAASKALGRTG